MASGRCGEVSKKLFGGVSTGRLAKRCSCSHLRKQRVRYQPRKRPNRNRPLAVLSTGGFLDAELGGLTPKEMQVAIEGDRLTGRQLTRALAASGADTAVNAKQIHRQRSLAARRAQDDR